ncbi:MAG: transcription antitermination factor NusB [Brumimicrobium sp.]|nr:transcription antitermination factor NusB [Brumimicrobium sp.]MCO5268036.1 transcription antitermination factor NusB [Brumimicrobium sp.]
MLNRRHLRIKVLQTLYAFTQTEGVEFLWAKKELLKAIDQMYVLYISLLQIFPELKVKAERRIDDNKNKYLPSEEDLHPNEKFVNNKVIQLIEGNTELRRQTEIIKANWMGAEKQELMRKLFMQILQSETYFEFMNNNKEGFEEDKEFMVQLFKTEIANFELLYDFFEEQSVYWMDDIDLTCSMVLKTIKSFEENKENRNEILPLYKADDDEQEFIVTLLREAIQNREDNLRIIDQLTKNWELERIAKMDVLLMELAITELIHFNNIPTKVTLNEYIDISKYYSTPKSNVFINGILDKAIELLEKEGRIKKTGRGLIKE